MYGFGIHSSLKRVIDSRDDKRLDFVNPEAESFFYLIKNGLSQNAHNGNPELCKFMEAIKEIIALDSLEPFYVLNVIPRIANGKISFKDTDPEIDEMPIDWWESQIEESGCLGNFKWQWATPYEYYLYIICKMGEKGLTFRSLFDSQEDLGIQAPYLLKHFGPEGGYWRTNPKDVADLEYVKEPNPGDLPLLILR